MELFSTKTTINPVTSFFLSLNSRFSEQTYFARLSLFCDFHFKTRNFDQCDWSTLSYISVLQYMRFESNNDKAHTTINLALSAIKGVAYECWQQELINIETYMRIKMIKKRKGTRAPVGRILAFDEINKVKRYFLYHQTNRDIRNYAVFALACGSGLRRRELLLLDVGDITENTVIIHGKGNKSRTVQLSSFVSDAVDSWINVTNRKSGPLFSKVDKNGEVQCNRISTMGIGCVIRQIIEECKLEHFTPHDLRRTFATTLLDIGADQLAVKELMGHASLNTTAIYDRRGEKKKIDAIKLLPF